MHQEIYKHADQNVWGFLECNTCKARLGYGTPRVLPNSSDAPFDGSRGAVEGCLIAGG